MTHQPMKNPLEAGEWILAEEDIEQVFRRINITEPAPLTSMAQARLFVAICEELWGHGA